MYLLIDEKSSSTLFILSTGKEPFFLIKYLDLLVKNFDLKLFTIFTVSLVALWTKVETLIDSVSSSFTEESLCCIIGFTVLLKVWVNPNQRLKLALLLCESEGSPSFVNNCVTSGKLLWSSISLLYISSKVLELIKALEKHFTHMEVF